MERFTRRSLVSAGVALGVGRLASGLSRDGTPTSRPARAIAAGSALTPPVDGPVEVVVAVSAGTTWIDFVGPLAVFETFHRDPADGRYKPRFRVTLASEQAGPAGKLLADTAFATAPQAHVVLIPAQPTSPALLAFIRRAAASADVTMSVCTGAAHLARAGLLRGAAATTHHKSIEPFRREFPDVNWVAGMRFVEGARVATSAGLTAGIDLALRVAERYYGRDWALEVAEHLEYEGRGWIV